MTFIVSSRKSIPAGDAIDFSLDENLPNGFGKSIKRTRMDERRQREKSSKDKSHHGPMIEKGMRAIFRAFLIADVSSLWCLEHVPEILRGRIFPRSVTKWFRVFTSL